MALWTITKITSMTSSIDPAVNVRYKIDCADIESTDIGTIYEELDKTDSLSVADTKAAMIAAGFTPTDIP